MSLTSAIRTAQSSLLNTALQTVVTSRNIAEASNENYSRRDAILVSSDSGARVVSILRATDRKLLWDGLQAYAESNAQSVISEGADRLQRLINGVENGTAPATLLSSFEDALQLYSNDASNTLLASSRHRLRQGTRRRPEFLLARDPELSRGNRPGDQGSGCRTERSPGEVQGRQRRDRPGDHRRCGRERCARRA